METIEKEKTTSVIVWDAGEKSGIDRYTAIFYGKGWT